MVIVRAEAAAIGGRRRVQLGVPPVQRMRSAAPRHDRLARRRVGRVRQLDKSIVCAVLFVCARLGFKRRSNRTQTCHGRGTGHSDALREASKSYGAVLASVGRSGKSAGNVLNVDGGVPAAYSR